MQFRIVYIRLYLHRLLTHACNVFIQKSDINLLPRK